MTTEFIILAASIFFAAVAVLVLVFGWRSIRQEGQRIREQAQGDAATVLDDAKRQGEAQMREAEVAAREKLLQARSEFEKVSRKQRAETINVGILGKRMDGHIWSYHLPMRPA